MRAAEKTRLARELHDELGALPTGAGTAIRVRIPLPAALPDPAAAAREGVVCPA